MVNTPEYIAAIDIGTSKIVIMIGQKNESGKLDILAHSQVESKGVTRGIIFNIEELSKNIKIAVDEIQKKTGYKLSKVSAGISGLHIMGINNRGYFNLDSYDHVIQQTDISELIKAMYYIPLEVGQEVFEIFPQDYMIRDEHGIKNPEGRLGKRLEGNFYSVIVETAAIRNIITCLRRVGLEVENIFIQAVASAKAVLTKHEMESGVALVDIGAGTIDLILYYDGIVRHIAVFSLGGNLISNDIREALSLEWTQAEDIKKNYCSAWKELIGNENNEPGSTSKEIQGKYNRLLLSTIVLERMGEIQEMIKLEIEKSGYKEKLSSGIVITGGGGLLTNLPQFIKLKTGIEARIGYPNESLINFGKQELSSPIFSSIIGLILRVLEYNPH